MSVAGGPRRPPAPPSRSPRRAARACARPQVDDDRHGRAPRCRRRGAARRCPGSRWRTASKAMTTRADEDQHALDGRGHVLDLLVAVGVRLVGRHVGRADREERHDRGDQVDGRVQRLGEQRDRAGDGAGDRLEQDQRRVRGDRERRGAGLGRLVLIGAPALASRRWLTQRARGAAAVADGVLLGRRRARPSCGRRRGRRGRRSGRSRSRRCRAGPSAIVPVQRPSKSRSSPVRGSTSAMTHT